MFFNRLSATVYHRTEIVLELFIEARTEKSQAPAVEYSKGMKARHAKFGEGEVVSYDLETQRVVVAFAEGEKTLSARIAKLEILE